jgi:hypothetical protein
MAVERRAEGPRNGAREGTGGRRKKRARMPGATTTVANLGVQEEEAVQPLPADCDGTMPVLCEPFDGERCTRR